MDAQTQHSQAFERQRLQPMYQRVATAIRTVDPHHILLLETSYHCNSGVASGIEPVSGPDGKRDPQQAYVPHAYDIVVDTPALVNANSQRVELIFNRHGKTAERLKMPMIVGEWGAFGGADERMLPSVRVLQRQFEKRLCGDTYWDYDRTLESKPHFKTLKRSIPSRIAGILLEYRCAPLTNEFTCHWREGQDITAPTVIYLTESTFQNRSIRLEPMGTEYQVHPVSDNSGAVYVSIPPTGQSAVRSLTVE